MTKKQKPNQNTLRAIKNADKGIGLKNYKSIEHMWKDLGLEKKSKKIPTSQK